ncbi:MAG: helix-turn-helix transcriptional regulator, partial [Ahrensia sp.]
MLSHERIWAAIDRLAAAHDLTPSGLAKRAGLDSTTFNKSKRFSGDGRARWPSTESISKIIDATDSDLSTFLALVGVTTRQVAPGLFNNSSIGLHEADSQSSYLPGAPAVRSVPLLGLAQAGSGGFFDDAGFPAGEGWDEVALPGADG